MAWAIESMVKVPLKIGILSVLLEGSLLSRILMDMEILFEVMMCMRHRPVMSPLTDVTTRVYEILDTNKNLQSSYNIVHKKSKGNNHDGAKGNEAAAAALHHRHTSSIVVCIIVCIIIYFTAKKCRQKKQEVESTFICTCKE